MVAVIVSHLLATRSSQHELQAAVCELASCSAGLLAGGLDPAIASTIIYFFLTSPRLCSHLSGPLLRAQLEVVS